MNRERRLDDLERTAGSSQRPTSGRPLNIIDFATNPKFLGLSLYPRQATVLKLLCLQLGLLTAYDREVIKGWSEGFTATEFLDGFRWAGRHGVVPDVLERIALCQQSGRPIWDEIILVLGRRGSKSLLASVVLAWKVWQLIELDDPQRHYSLPPTKRVLLPVFSASRDSAKRDLFGDVVSRFRDSPCFEQFIDRIGDSTVTLFTPAQLRRNDPANGRRGLIEISASPTTSRSARGPAMFSLAIDEAAHLDGDGSTNSAEEVLNAARPALAQFALDATTVLPSSPSSMTGGFYAEFCQACAIDPITGGSLNPHTFALQLPSWDLYLDYERAHELEQWPGGPCFKLISQPILAFDDYLQTAQRNNPEMFEVEFESQFASGLRRYFTESTVNKLFGPWGGRRLVNQHARTGNFDYIIHCDPSTSGANFGLAISHREEDGGELHTLFDLLHAWRPEDFPDHVIDYNVVLEKLLEYVDSFRPSAVHYDNHNTAFFHDRLAPEVHRRLPHTIVSKVSWSQEQKFEGYEHLKTLTNQGLVHAPANALAILEARFLQAVGYKIGHPTNGPCQTDDLIDPMAWSVFHQSKSSTWVIDELRQLTPVFSSANHLFDDFYQERRRPQGFVNPAAYPRWHPRRTGR